MQNPAMRRILELGQRSGSAVRNLSPHKGLRGGTVCHPGLREEECVMKRYVLAAVAALGLLTSTGVATLAVPLPPQAIAGCERGELAAPGPYECPTMTP